MCGTFPVPVLIGSGSVLSHSVEVYQHLFELFTVTNSTLLALPAVISDCCASGKVLPESVLYYYNNRQAAIILLF